MNWNKIKKLYPKSFRDLVKYFDLVGTTEEILDCSDDIYLSMAVHYLELYEFFDKHIIMLGITSDLEVNKETNEISYNEFTWEVRSPYTDFRMNQDIMNTRKEAEVDGFLECFRVLEIKLNEQL